MKHTDMNVVVIMYLLLFSAFCCMPVPHICPVIVL